MEYIRVTKENLEKEHICCAISNNKDIQVSSKKDWMMQCFDDGLVFLKSTERGKCFIEYIPAKNAWVPIVAENYMYIDCFWVSGSFKGHGYSNDLLNACIKDAKEKGKSGLCILSSAKKKPFLWTRHGSSWAPPPTGKRLSSAWRLPRPYEGMAVRQFLRRRI